MIEFILSLPLWIGIIVAMILAAISGFAVYAISYKLISKYQVREMYFPASVLFSAVGILISLILAQAFGQVAAEWRATENAIENEVLAISDTFNGLLLFDVEGTRDIRMNLIDYTLAVAGDDWPALADDRLGEQAEALKQQIAVGVIGLEAGNPVQEEIRDRMLADGDLIFDHRRSRLNQARTTSPIFVYVVIFGFLITMVFFGVYPWQIPLAGLIAFYTVFIGLVLYLILALSDPFQGSLVIDPTPFENLAEELQAANR